MPTLLDHLSAWRPFTAVVVGDFMLDGLVYGHADRLSPEAPVPVLHVQRTEERPGGASNVCLNLAAMHGAVRAVGATGEDLDGGTLRRLLSQADIDTRALIHDATRPTTVKRSLVGLAQHRHPQKMFRVDYESREPLSPDHTETLLLAFDKALAGADVVCIEDYNKGVCTPAVCAAVIERSRAAGVPVLVDPAAVRDYAKYRCATAVTPNRTEAALAVGEKPEDGAPPEAHAGLARRLLDDLDLEAAVITLDRHGALLLERGEPGAPPREPHVVPTLARQVYDVTGAGDMVLAALAAARANGIAWPDAVRFANAAAGLEVEVFGVVPIPFARIHREVIRRERLGVGVEGGVGQMPGGGGDAGAGESGGGRKLHALQDLLVEVNALRAEGKTVVFTNGCFDLVHRGHLSLLERAAALGDFLIVALNTDASVRRLKGPDRPIIPELDRARILGGFECVGAVLLFDGDTPEPEIDALRPHVLVKGGEYAIDQIPGARSVLAHGGRVELLEMVGGRSTTGTLARIRPPSVPLPRSARPENDPRAEL